VGVAQADFARRSWKVLANENSLPVGGQMGED